MEVLDLAIGTKLGSQLANGISFSLCPGHYAFFKGTNGSGKSTLARSVLGYQMPLGGKVTLHVSEDEIAYLPQLSNVRFFLPMTLADVMGLGRRHSAAWEKAAELALLDESMFCRQWDTSSGGERQKALLTRTLLNILDQSSPTLIILDEPFNHLDFSSRERLTAILKELLAEKKCGVILVSHEGELNELAPSVVVDLGGGLP